MFKRVEEIEAMRLFYSPGTCSLAPHIVLREIEQTFDLERVNFVTRRTDTGRDFNGINPKGYVPALQLDSGEILTETAAILQYIADMSSSSMDLAPKAGTFERARLQEHLSFVSTELHKAFDAPFTVGVSQEARKVNSARVASKFDYVESVLTDGRPYLLGDTFSVADAYLFVVSRWTKPAKIDLGRWSYVSAFVNRVDVRPSVIAAKIAEGLH